MSNKEMRRTKKLIHTLIKYCIDHIFHICTHKHHDYFIYLLLIQFLSVPYKFKTPHDYGQTAPVKERHILKRPFSIFKRKQHDMSLSTSLPLAKLQHKAESVGELIREPLNNNTTHGRGPGVTTCGSNEWFIIPVSTITQQKILLAASYQHTIQLLVQEKMVLNMAFWFLVGQEMQRAWCLTWTVSTGKVSDVMLSKLQSVFTQKVNLCDFF